MGDLFYRALARSTPGGVGGFEGVCVNYRHPDPRRGERRVGFAPDVAFPLDPLDPVDPLQNFVRLANIVFYNDVCTFCRNLEPMFGPNPYKPNNKINVFGFEP